MSLVFSGTLVFLVLCILPLAHAQYQTSLDEGLFVFVQTTVRNSDGVLVTYLESSKFTHLDVSALYPFLDFEASRGDDPVISVDGVSYQIIRRAQSQEFDGPDVIASTNLHDTVDGKPIHLARFAHDGYPVSAGDTMESIWTFIRLV